MASEGAREAPQNHILVMQGTRGHSRIGLLEDSRCPAGMTEKEEN